MKASVKSYAVDPTGLRLNVAPDTGPRLDIRLEMTPAQMRLMAEDLLREARKVSREA
jgi:hypothetical protein